MNILFLAPVYLSRPSAQRTHVSEVANNMALLGHKIHLIALDKGDCKLHKNIIFYKPSPVLNFPGFRLISKRMQKVSIKRIVEKILKKNKIDVIYKRDKNIAAKINKKIPCILEINGIFSADAKVSGATKEKIEEIDKKVMMDLKQAKKIIAVSKGIKDYYSRLGIPQEKFVVLSNGVNIRKFKPINANGCKKKLGLDPNLPIIIFIGQFRPWHGLEYAIKALHKIKIKIPKVKLILVGDSGKYQGFKFKPTKEELSTLAKKLGVEKNIIFAGRIKYKQIPLYINASDVCIAPFVKSRSNVVGLSNLKIYEYLACGKPIVLSDVSEIGDFVKQNKCGITVEPENPKELANAIIRLLKNKKLRQKFGKNGRNTVIRSYDWNLITKKILNVCKEVIK